MLRTASLPTVGTLKVRKFRTHAIAPLTWKLRNWLRWGYIKGWLAHWLGWTVSKLFGTCVLLPELRVKLFRGNGTTVDYGVVGYQVVTTAFCEYMVDQLISETSTWGDFKYHDAGVGTTNEANGDTGMETTDGESRATGTQVESTSVGYRSVGTIAYTTTKAITEHGLFNTAASTTLLDRTVFTAVNVINGDSIEFTYTITVTAGG